MKRALSACAATRSISSALGRADVGDHGGLAAAGERLGDQLGQRPDRRGAEDDGGIGDRLGDRARGAIERTQLERPLERRRVAIEADHLGVQPPPRGEPDRAADQADAEDRDLHPLRR